MTILSMMIFPNFSFGNFKDYVQYIYLPILKLVKQKQLLKRVDKHI